MELIESPVDAMKKEGKGEEKRMRGRKLNRTRGKIDERKAKESRKRS